MGPASKHGRVAKKVMFALGCLLHAMNKLVELFVHGGKLTDEFGGAFNGLAIKTFSRDTHILPETFDKLRSPHVLLRHPFQIFNFVILKPLQIKLSVSIELSPG